MVGTTISHYRVGQRLGAGGMGEVYLAEDVRLGREVALKFLAPAFESDPEKRSRFMVEARAASSLRSSNIAAIYDIGEHSGAIFIVMEYVEGETLLARLERGPVPLGDALDLTLQIADALQDAHSRGIVHRDIKPANIMVTPRGIAKILDFGLARMTDQKSRLLDSDGPTIPPVQDTLPGALVGTILYMSPEQARGRPVDHRSDIFSLGVVLYQMLAGRPPFAADNLPELLHQIVHRNPPPLSSVASRTPKGLEAAVNRSLEKDPDRRYQSVEDFQRDLRDVRYAFEHGAPPSSGRRNALSSSHSSARNAAAATANSVAVMTFTNITREPADEWIGSGIAETVTADLKNVPGLSVIGRERIFDALRNVSPDSQGGDERFVIEVGQGLGASWILTGGYQRFGELIRITARVIDVASGNALKTVKIDGRVSEIFSLQDKIVYELSQGLNVQLAHSDVAEIERDETTSVEAYQNYSRGMMLLRLASRDSLDRAIHFFEKALEHDPMYASAWALLGTTFELKGTFLSMPELVEKAIGLEHRAIELDPTLAIAHSTLASALLNTGRYDAAIDASREAIRLEPKNANAHSALARAYWLGRGLIDEALAAFDTAIKLNPEGGYSYLQIALLYTIKGDYDRAEAACRRAIDLQEQYISGTEGLLIVGAHTRLGYVQYRRGQYKDAIGEYERELAFLSGSDHALSDRARIELHEKIGAAYQKLENTEEAERHFKIAIKGFEERLAKGADDPFTRYYMACLYALKGDAERAAKHLQISIDQFPALNRRRAALDPEFDGIRQDPIFITLLPESAPRPANQEI